MQTSQQVSDPKDEHPSCESGNRDFICYSSTYDHGFIRYRLLRRLSLGPLSTRKTTLAKRASVLKKTAELMLQNQEILREH